jgi:hypothetical protein
MLRGPRGEKRPADVIGNAVKIMRIATGEETNDLSGDGTTAKTRLLRRSGPGRGASQDHDAGARGPTIPCLLFRSAALLDFAGFRSGPGER